MGIYGVDWASYQGSWPAAKGMAFVFIKVTEGESYVNPYWESQATDALSVGAVLGKYHYPHMHNNADAEVNYFLSQAKVKPGEIVVLDWEGYDANNTSVSKAEQLAYKEEFLRYLKTKLPHNPVGMYCNTDYWYNVDTTGHTGDFLWIATAGLPAGSPGIKAAWKFHQYGAGGVDKDYGNFANAAALKTWVASFAPVVTPPVVIPPVIIPPEDIVTPQDKQDIIDGVLKGMTSQPVRDGLAFADFYLLQKVFSFVPLPGTGNMQSVVNSLQTELKSILDKLDPAVVAQIVAAVETALKAVPAKV
jgi:hypothetical protein